MDARHNRLSLIYGVSGIALQVLCVPVALIVGELTRSTYGPFLGDLFGIGLAIIGTALLIVGLCYYARGKGQSAWFGAFGILGIIGLIVLGLLPDRDAETKKHKSVRNSISDLPEPGGVEFQCLGCRYMLNGVSGNACPECGRAFDPENLMSVAVIGIDPPKSHWTSRWSLICGIMGLMMFCLPCFSQLAAILGICFGHIAMSKAQQLPQRSGRGVAIAGLILSYLSIPASVLYFFGVIMAQSWP